eukprot:scaffold2238_cov117-Isochrysis_galbana.AAC.5
MSSTTLLLAALAGARALDLCTSLPLLGSRCVVLSGVSPALSLPVADELLRCGAACELLVPLPRSGLASGSDAEMRLAVRIQRHGFDRLMEELGFKGCDPSSGMAGNRQRLSWAHVRADDVESMALKLFDADVLVVHAATERLLGDEEPARRAMRWLLLRHLLEALRRRGLALQRDSRVPGVWWTHLARAKA